MRVLWSDFYITCLSVGNKISLLYSGQQHKLNMRVKTRLLHGLLLFSVVMTSSTFAMEPADAARLLQQATFGPTASEVEKLKTMTAEAWIDQQLSLPATLHRPYLPEGDLARSNHQRINVWFKTALHAEDQLRQRMAYALSEIFVVSQVGNIMLRKQSGLMYYYDTLINGALGNYRDLMYDVTMHPVMGTYLTYSPNEAHDGDGASEADENYAREIMQLMSLGPYLLQQNGEYQLQDGEPVATYSQEQIKGFAKVFTGLCYADRCDERFATMETPMTANYSKHDVSEKQLLSTVLPANPDSVKSDIDAALDDIFAHQNIAPFVSKRLIQLLITSNPTPAYVARVAAVFNNNGKGVKGDMAAVAKAIFLDDEARNGHVSGNADNYGKLKEPIIMLTNYFRALDVYPEGDAPYYYGLEGSIGQAPLVANSVFNFFRFDFTQPGLPEGMVSPEFQINSEDRWITTNNFWLNEVRFKTSRYDSLAALIESYDTREAGLNAYADYIDLMFTQGQMSAALRAQVIGLLQVTRDKDLRADGTRKNQFFDQDAIGNVMIMLFLSPEFAIQR
ncbi:DUF1800 domain-containing protein [Paraneptunicella aestuarii]|uniref:DUF1800 domain-containing protein n=1 Tax=Paraneptunicella aestuarii TaxID=2831148 RepID=UPI001E6044C8|nr:DUF1800 family protein [Paraneptunicella aestuarii]